jgi:hypothetical protein
MDIKRIGFGENLVNGQGKEDNKILLSNMRYYYMHLGTISDGTADVLMSSL